MLPVLESAARPAAAADAVTPFLVPKGHASRGVSVAEPTESGLVVGLVVVVEKIGERFPPGWILEESPISTVPRFQRPPRRFSVADFPCRRICFCFFVAGRDFLTPRLESIAPPRNRGLGER